MDPIAALMAEVVDCRRCSRLVAHREGVAREKVRRYREWEYWGRPVGSFGDPAARLLVVGLAPAAHGGNRTGRMFTGDVSGDWLYAALHRYGFASQPISTHRGDGLTLRDCYITAVVHCAPPANRPLPSEIAACRGYLLRELDLLRRVRVVIVLGRVAFDGYLRTFQAQGHLLPRPVPRFAHGATYRLDRNLRLLCSYHPSRQNTQTRRLTVAMFHTIFAAARRLLPR